MSLRVAVFGAGGRMGATVCAAVAGDDELELVAAIDPHHAGFELREVTRDQSLGDVVVHPAAESLEPGEVEYACHLPGHYEFGMRGTITVVP